MEKILVSVIVVTYNFEEIILETLESIKNQTYKNIELIITDDNSTDKTVEISEKWAEENRERFNDIRIIKNRINVGPTKNYNIGLKDARGEWVKYISDDIMTPDFIEDSLEMVSKNSEIEILFSQAISFKGKLEEKNFLGKYPEDKDLFKYDLDSRKQLEYMLEHCYVSAPTNFIKKSLLEEVGYCDEKYKYFEDYPLWIKILETGRKLYFNPKINLYYRRWEKSVSYNNTNYLNEKLIKFEREYFENEKKYKIKNPIKRFEINLQLYREEQIIKAGNKRLTLYSKLLRYLQPSRYKKKKYLLIFVLVLSLIYFYRIG